MTSSAGLGCALRSRRGARGRRNPKSAPEAKGEGGGMHRSLGWAHPPPFQELSTSFRHFRNLPLASPAPLLAAE
eukprot:3752253-Pyramimonas_sp.AAC.1